MTDDDDRMRSKFDQIVEGLELDWSGETTPEPAPDQTPEPARGPAPEHHPELEEPEFDDLPDEPFYRDVRGVPIVPKDRRITMAWIAVMGAPLLMVFCTVFGIWLARSIVVGSWLIFVAGAIYLFSRLPEHGRPDGPDGGAVL